MVYTNRSLDMEHFCEQGGGASLTTNLTRQTRARLPHTIEPVSVCTLSSVLSKQSPPSLNQANSILVKDAWLGGGSRETGVRWGSKCPAVWQTRPPRLSSFPSVSCVVFFLLSLI